MKKIIFVIDSLACGGAEKSLVALLKHLDYSKYDVDLLYFSHEDEYFKDDIPSQVHIIQPDINTQLALSSKSFVIHNLKLVQYLPLAFLRIWLEVIRIIRKNKYKKCRIQNWNKLKKYVPPLQQCYDVAIGFLEAYPVYYVIDKVKAKRYISWLRTDYQSAGFCSELDLPYYNKSDSICVLSEEMKQNFLKVFPSLNSKVVVFPNILEMDVILERSREVVEFDDNFHGIRIISSGTLRKVKGYDVALRACKRLIEMGCNFRWYILGSGEEREKILAEIRRLGVENHFILLGNKRNPHAFVVRSDIFVQCSYREGFSNTVFEAKCLQRPIVITDAPGMNNQIENGVNGFVVPIGDDEKVADAVRQLIDSHELREKFTTALEQHLKEHNNELLKLLILFDKIT